MLGFWKGQYVPESRERRVFPKTRHPHARDVLEVNPRGSQRQVYHGKVRPEPTVHDCLGRGFLVFRTDPAPSSEVWAVLKPAR